MTDWLWLGLAVLALWAGIAYARRKSEYADAKTPSKDDEIDHEELERAEREVKDLDVSARPEDGFEGDDWGPGVPRPPAA